MNVGLIRCASSLQQSNPSSLGPPGHCMLSQKYLKHNVCLCEYVSDVALREKRDRRQKRCNKVFFLRWGGADRTGEAVAESIQEGVCVFTRSLHMK